jgi:hypothetical protein
MEVKESSTSKCISQLSITMHICHLRLKLDWSSFNINVKWHCGPCLRMSWNMHYILVEGDNFSHVFLSIRGPLRSQCCEACHIAWSHLHFPHSRLPIERCHFVTHSFKRRFTPCRLTFTPFVREVTSHQALIANMWKIFSIDFQKYFIVWLHVIHTFNHSILTQPMNFRGTNNVSLFRIWSARRSGKYLLVLANTGNLGFDSRRDPRLYIYSFQEFYLFWNGTSSSTTGGVWLPHLQGEWLCWVSLSRTHFHIVHRIFVLAKTHPVESSDITQSRN